MGRSFTRFLAPMLCLCLMVSGCNSTDPLIPQAPVGSATYKLSEPPGLRAGTPQAAASPQSMPPSANAMGGDNAAPQNTLQAQAQALENRTPRVRQPVATEQAEPEPQSEQQPEDQPPPEPQTRTASANATTGTIRFLPIIGAPVQAVTPLSRQLGNEARSHGLTIKSSADPSTEHILKGYLSAFNDGQKTTVIYVWDILDASGQRLNRLQGQEEVPGAAKDAWSSVPPEVMQAIASKTIAQYLAFKGAG